jgi:hypothetical protein
MAGKQASQNFEIKESTVELGSVRPKPRSNLGISSVSEPPIFF